MFKILSSTSTEIVPEKRTMFKILSSTSTEEIPEQKRRTRSMFGNTFGSMTTTVLKKGLDTASLRQHVISNNIANVNTPGFKKSNVTFEMELKQALGRGVDKLPAQRTHPKHLQFSQTDLSRVKGRVVVEADTIFRNDLNNVDIDEEMTNQAKNAIMYEALATRIGGRFRLMKKVIASK